MRSNPAYNSTITTTYIEWGCLKKAKKLHRKNSREDSTQTGVEDSPIPPLATRFGPFWGTSGKASGFVFPGFHTRPPINRAAGRAPGVVSEADGKLGLVLILGPGRCHGCFICLIEAKGTATGATPSRLTGHWVKAVNEHRNLLAFL